MKKLEFKTNINCEGCIAKVTPFLDAEKNILKWQVDTSTPYKILTIETESIPVQDIMSLVQRAGFMIEQA